MIYRSTVTIAGAFLLVLFGTATATYAQEWSEEPMMPQALYSVAAVAEGSHVYVAGGTDDRGNVSDALYRYDVVAKSWQDDLPNMDEERYFAAAAVLNGKIYVMGGRDDDNEVLESVEVFDPGTQEWDEAHDLEEGRYGHTAVVLNGRLYVLGGADEDGNVLETVEVYDADEDEWEMSSLWKLDPPRAAFATVAVGEAAYSFGGISRVPLPHVQRFDFQLGSEVIIPPGLLGARAYIGAVAVGDSIFVIGGRNARDRVLDDVVLFVPSEIAGAQWKRGPRLGTARESFGAVEVNGRVYVIGGRNPAEGAVASMESLEAGTPVAIEDPLETAFELEQNHPNPFTTSTRISFTVADAAEYVQLDIFDVQGRLVQRLVDGVLSPGRHDVEWDGAARGRSAPSGVYFYVLKHGPSQHTRMMTRIR